MEVPVWIGQRKVMAVVDMTMPVTVINHEFSVELGYAPVKKVKLRNTQMDSRMEGGVEEKFGFRLGDKKYSWDVVAGDIEPAVIVGIDFLHSQKFKINLDSNVPLNIPVSIGTSSSTVQRW